MQKTLSILLVLLATSTAAQAFEVVGSEARLGFSTLTGDTGVAKTNLQGAVELGFGPRFGMQADLGLFVFKDLGDTATGITLHGLYHVTEQTSLGMFYGQERLNGETARLTGFEVGQTSASFSGEAHIALGKQGGNTMQLMGIGGRYSVSDKFGLGASLQRADLDNDADVTRLGIKADMALGQTATAFVELGNLAGGIDGSGGSEGFVGIGADFKFGAKHGTTFGKRGLFDMLPGL